MIGWNNDTLKIVPIEISLIDDVVFSGSLICKVADALREKGVIVKEVLAGVAVKENLDVITSTGIEVKGGFYISNVLDEVCERDFYFGIAQSGQSSLQRDGKVLKQPYFMPFGLPVESASVPEGKASEFSRECLECSYELWKEIQKQSNRVVTNEDLPESIFNTPGQPFEILPLLQEASQNVLEQ